ncbi:MAG: hypothetical protein J6S94_01025 [Bacteroidaceae bacterium]|nr:hypothetical protein [Bacteroidaceae bacterium]
MNNILLSPHFSLLEFTESPTARKHGIANVPPAEAVDNLKRLCANTLEPLREALQLPVVITSGFRTKALNDLLAHSSERSQHMQGQAADFYVGEGPVSGSKIQDCPSGESAYARDNSSKLGSPLAQSQTSGDLQLETGESSLKPETPRQRLIKAFRLIITSEQIDYDQLILYPTFIHVSYVSKEKNRRTILLGMRNGKLGYGKCSVQNALKIE